MHTVVWQYCLCLIRQGIRDLHTVQYACLLCPDECSDDVFGGDPLEEYSNITASSFSVTGPPSSARMIPNFTAPFTVWAAESNVMPQWIQVCVVSPWSCFDKSELPKRPAERKTITLSLWRFWYSHCVYSFTLCLQVELLVIHTYMYTRN